MNRNSKPNQCEQVVQTKPISTGSPNQTHEKRNFNLKQFTKFIKLIFSENHFKKMPSSKQKIAAKKAAMTEEEKSIARKKDAMRKQSERALKGIKKRRDMSPETLDRVREADRKRWNSKQSVMTEEEREEVRVINRKSKAKYRDEGKVKIEKHDNKMRKSRQSMTKEQANIKQVLRMRKTRLLYSYEMKISARKKAREGMIEFRKEGRLREYMQRKKRGFCEMKWKRFLEENPKFMALEKKKIQLMREIERQREEKWEEDFRLIADIKKRKAMGLL